MRVVMLLFELVGGDRLAVVCLFAFLIACLLDRVRGMVWSVRREARSEKLEVVFSFGLLGCKRRILFFCRNGFSIQLTTYCTTDLRFFSVIYHPYCFYGEIHVP